MSKTQIHLTMENNNKVNSVIGFNANNNGACFEFLFNKLSGNEKQSNNAPDFDFLTGKIFFVNMITRTYIPFYHYHNCCTLCCFEQIVL